MTISSPAPGSVVLNTGPSPAGWSSLEAWLRCKTLYGWRARARRLSNAGLLPYTEALARGTLVHVGLAQLFAKSKAIQDGSDPRVFADPLTGMARTAREIGDIGMDMLPVANRAVRAYVEEYGHERPTVHGVESLLETTFHAPGLPPGYYTARADRTTVDSAGKYWIWDAKTTHKIEAKVTRRYTLSGQILGLWLLGAQTYGPKFGGVRLDIIGVDPIGFERVTPEPAPFTLAKFPGIVCRARAEIAEFEAAKLDPSEWPASPSEMTCFTPYGICPAFELCRWGPRG